MVGSCLSADEDEATGCGASSCSFSNVKGLFFGEFSLVFFPFWFILLFFVLHILSVPLTTVAEQLLSFISNLVFSKASPRAHSLHSSVLIPRYKQTMCRMLAHSKTTCFQHNLCVCLFTCFLARLHKNYWNDVNKIFLKGASGPDLQLITF